MGLLTIMSVMGVAAGAVLANVYEPEVEAKYFPGSSLALEMEHQIHIARLLAAEARLGSPEDKTRNARLINRLPIDEKFICKSHTLTAGEGTVFRVEEYIRGSHTNGCGFESIITFSLFLPSKNFKTGETFRLGELGGAYIFYTSGVGGYSVVWRHIGYLINGTATIGEVADGLIEINLKATGQLYKYGPESHPETIEIDVDNRFTFVDGFRQKA